MLSGTGLKFQKQAPSRSLGHFRGAALCFGEHDIFGFLPATVCFLLSLMLMVGL